MAHEIISRMQARYAVHLPQREGAVQAVRIAATHYRVALASGSPRALGEHVLRAMGLDQILTVTLYGDEVEHGKPAPDVYLRVLERIGVRPEHAVGVEDSGNGIRSLHAAGMGIIAAPSPGYALSADILALAGAHIQSLTEFSVGSGRKGRCEQGESRKVGGSVPVVCLAFVHIAVRSVSAARKLPFTNAW